MVERIKDEPLSVGELHHVFAVIANTYLIGERKLHLVIANVRALISGANRNFNALCYLFYHDSNLISREANGKGHKGSERS